MKNLIVATSLVLIAFMFSSCDTDDNTSYQTDDINAYSEFIKIKTTDWQYDDAGPRHYVRYNMSKIDENVINRGAVLVYMAEIGTTANRWRLMPRTEVFFNREKDSILYTIEWGYWIEPGILEMEYFISKDWDLSPQNEVEVKIVVLDDLDDYDMSKVNIENYEEVKSKFKIEEIDLPSGLK